MKRIFLLGLVLLLTLSACSAPGDMEVHSAWVRPTARGENAAVYLTLHNHSSDDDELIGASSPAADAVELHESTMENDVMQMNMIMSVPIASEEEIVFAPGGLHIMLIGVKEALVLGGHIAVVLNFNNHEDIAVEVQIENAMPEEDHQEGGDDH
jgi:copper(I)-binding protein